MATDKVSERRPRQPAPAQPRPPPCLRPRRPPPLCCPEPRRRRATRVAPPPRLQAGQTALMLAAGNGKLDCLEYLIANKGAKVNATNIVSAAPPAAHPSPFRPSARPPPSDTTCPPAAAAHPRVCGRPRVSARQVDGAAPRGLQGPRALRRHEALLKAGADARLKTQVSDSAEGRGGRRPYPRGRLRRNKAERGGADQRLWCGRGAHRNRRAPPSPHTFAPLPSPSAVRQDAVEHGKEVWRG